MTACGQDCGEGTVRQGDACVPVGFSCGAGTVLSDGVCVSEIDACGDGTVVDGTTCVLDDGSVICGEGTQFDVALARCVATVAGACGTNTIAVDDTCVVAAHLRLIHAVSAPNGEVIDVYVDGLLVMNDMTYLGATRFFDVPAGTRDIAIALPESGAAIGDPVPDDAIATSVTVSPVTDNVAVLVGFDSDSFAAAGRQLPRSVEADDLAFTVVQSNPDAPALVDVEHEGADHYSEGDDATLVDNLAFGTASPVVTMSASRFVMGFGGNGGADVDRYRASWEDLGGETFTLVIGAPEDDYELGRVWVYSRNADTGVELPLFD
ncbi:MAG TPA: DUF4397 domain-containing protein [Myxococcota bacterium]|nr:DUF4397 domain-containing protein [Myxococcota bacterium]